MAQHSQTVNVSTEQRIIPTYLPAMPDLNPMFLEKRVYQGSSGKVYPLPFTDRIAEKPVDREWKVVWIENEFVRVMILPEIGGRIHAIQDKTNGYDLIYNQPVIKPALVGLTGPWASGGIEFNWPQHHRPATFLPVEVKIEEHADGSKTVWCGDHDPMCRMKGMHGVCLHPGKAIVELRARAYNRTTQTQTFLWWANVATRVHEAYQSFFPPDVYYVADHARRSMSDYPLARGFYYGVNYGERGRKGIPENERPTQFVPPHVDQSKLAAIPTLPDYAANDLSFYANIPTPCSYMCMGSHEDFFGGYDYRAQAGIVHVANHHISPGKKQWTWGNHDFGYAWDRNLTDADAHGEFAPYIEIMAGVYTDNQPDFSYLAPGETKSWSQYWYPIQQIGPAHHANARAAISLRLESQSKTARRVRLGFCVTEVIPGGQIELFAKGKKIFSHTFDLTPGQPILVKIDLPKAIVETDLRVCVSESSGAEVISYQPRPRAAGKVPPPATEPPPAAEIDSPDELYITGLHLEQYRHATRCPTLYWKEALRRDPLDSRCNVAMGSWHMKRGEFDIAEQHFRAAISRLTRRNANPYDGEAYYQLGLCLRHLGRDAEAYAAFYKACWNQAWASAGYHAVAEIDCARGDWSLAVDHLTRSLRLNSDNLRARNLKTIALGKLGRDEQAKAELAATLALDPLDTWARQLANDSAAAKCDLQTALDIAHDLARAGLFAEAISLLNAAHAEVGDLPDQSWGAGPLVQYTLGWLEEKRGDAKSASQHYKAAAELSSDYCFPYRVEEISILTSAMKANGRDAKAPYYLGNLLYDRRRHAEAISLWEKSAKMDASFSIVWRNLGIGYFNISKKPAKARKAYDRAFAANPNDGRLLFERDQLWKRLGEKPIRRLRELEKHPELVRQRDDLSVELCALYNQTGEHEKALTLVSERHFQPWEGGEGGPLGQWIRSNLALGRQALDDGEANRAAERFAEAIRAPQNLGEARHLLANNSDIHYWLGVALDLAGDQNSAREHLLSAATFKGDFQEMSVRAFSEMTYYSALAWEKLGKKKLAKQLLQGLLKYAIRMQRTPAKIDYFATSLPTMLLFDDDLQQRQKTAGLFLESQARLGLGQTAAAKKLLAEVLRRDPNQAAAADLLGELSNG